MKKGLAATVVMALALALALALGGCAATPSSDSTKAQDTKAEAGEYTGTLVLAYKDQLVLAGDDGDMEFATDKETAFELGDVDGMYLDDILAVNYHMGDDGMVADTVSIVEHVEPALEFAGTLVDWDDDSITLASETLTATFQKDADSYIVGDFSQGDKIELTYLGNLSEYPYANVIAVVSEVEQPDTLTVHGSVSELADGTLLLAIDSAHAYRFAITDGTKITGAANTVKTGDKVDIEYRGHLLKETPQALAVNIAKQGEARAYVINGKITEVKKNSLSLETSKAKYTFGTSANTRFYGDEAAKGNTAEITYTGALGDKPEASIVYSVKDAKSTKAKQQASKSSSSASKSSSSSTSKSSSSSASKSSSSAASKSSASAEPKSSSSSQASSSASAQEAEKKADNGNDRQAEPQEAVEPETSEPEQEQAAEQDEATEPEPEPEATEPEEADEPEEAVEPEPEATEPEEASEPEPETTEPEEAAEPEPEPEPEPEAAEPEPEPEPEEAAEPEPEPDLKVSGQGTIVSGNEGKQTIVFKMKNGSEITLEYDGDTKISSGYIPEAGDVVKVVYGSNSLKLRSLQLVSRPSEEKASKEEEKSKDKAAKEEAAEDEDEE